MKKTRLIFLIFLLVTALSSSLCYSQQVNQYDSNQDWIIGDFELLSAIDDWAVGSLGDFNLLDLIDFWATGCYEWNLVEEQYIADCFGKIRIITPGDFFHYEVLGTWNNGTESINFTGTMNYQVLSSTMKSPITGDDCFDIYASGNLTTPNGPLVVSTHTYALQDLDGSSYIYGQDFGTGSGAVWVTSPVQGYFLSSESPMFVGQANGSFVTYSDGSSTTYSSVNIAIENVLTDIGTIEAYRLNQDVTIDYINGNRAVESNTVWIAPNIGMIKTISDTVLYSFGEFQLSQEMTITLTGTSVSY